MVRLIGPLARIPRGLVAAAILLAAAGQTVLGASADWPTYHGSNDRAGNDTSANPFSAIGQEWLSPTLDGDIYAQPLVVGNQVIVATENNSIYSLDVSTGAPTWTQPAHFGTPVSLDGRWAGCGNVNPLGILGTPVISTSTGIVYAVAFVETGTAVSYELVAVHLSDGSERRLLDMSGALQRALPAHGE